MAGALVFGVVLAMATLVSARAHRTLLSTTVLFLMAGLVTGRGALGWVDVGAGDPIVHELIEIALFAVLFTDGMQVGLKQLASAWRLPGRALLLGMPLTIAMVTLLARALTGLAWGEALLLGAVLSPTDPVLSAAIVGREAVPYRLRHLLNVESGLNDGLALPVVLVSLSALVVGGSDAGEVASELVGGALLGLVVPWTFHWLERTALFGAADRYQALGSIAVALVVFAAGQEIHANAFIAAFVAGNVIATVSEVDRDAFRELGETVSELLKLIGVFLFGALLSFRLFAEIPVGGLVFAVLVLSAVRPAALALALPGGGLPRREWAAAAWFGPKGFASVVYALLVLRSGIDVADQVYALVALTVTISIVVHSSTDGVVADWLGTPADDDARAS